MERDYFERVDRVSTIFIIAISIMLLGISNLIGWNKGFEDSNKLYDSHIDELKNIYKKHTDNMEKEAFKRGVEVGKNSQVNRMLTEEMIKNYPRN